MSSQSEPKKSPPSETFQQAVDRARGELNFTTLTDDSLPDTSGLLQNIAGPPQPFDSKAHKAKTRKMLALIALGVLGVFHGAILTLLALDIITLAELTGIIAAFSGLQTLTAVAFAFYFAKS